VLIDADLRKGILHRQFDVPVQPGFLEVLTEKESWRKAVQPTKHDNLFLLPRGGTSNKSGELFLNPATARVLRELGQEYEFVVVDSPPVMAADDVASLAPHVEGVLFVIRAQHTSARVARAALELLYQRNVQVLGLVFNAVEPNAAEYYYYKYKDYYTAYPTT
jgi:Mrp family chromosome partitioning ATPase